MPDVCQWLYNDPVSGNPVLRITTNRCTHEYEVEKCNETYRLWRLDSSTFFLICWTIETKGTWWCDCPANKYGVQPCKHIRALKAALKKTPKFDGKT